MDKIVTRGETTDVVQPDPELVSVVVEHDDRPDQCTIYNPDTSGVDRMSSWITAERETLVDLYSVR